ncbi:MAG TPA: hypothetical protein VMY42_28765 [Thermoguttaceae bacterium]|nr:hypothetical protein [Thermoguttaceae bacterium]
MEAPPLPTSDHESWAQQFSKSLDGQRDRVREFLAAQQERTERAEAELAEQLQQIAAELAQSHRKTRSAKEEIEQRSEQIARETRTLESLKEELDQRKAQWEQLQHRAAEQQRTFAEQIRHQQDELGRRHEELERRHEELARRQTELGEAEPRLHHDRRELELARGEMQAEREQLAALRERLDARQAELDDAQQRLATARAETESQRRRIAREFRAQHTAHLKELDRRRVELERRDGAERDALVSRLAETETRLREAQQRLADATSVEPGDASALEDLERRYEMALDDLRELKAENAKLQTKLSQAPAAAAPPSAGGALNWEAQKQRMLASLKSDFDEDGEDEEEAAEKIEIEEVVRKTDEALAAKDREIEELKQVLQTQSSNVGSVAVGAAALGEMLDADALVQEERENLKKLQEEWRDKLRQAEIDLSVERAKVGRERTAIEEKLRLLEERRGSSADAAGESGSPSKATGRRWLARLGLKDLDAESRP